MLTQSSGQGGVPSHGPPVASVSSTTAAAHISSARRSRRGQEQPADRAGGSAQAEPRADHAHHPEGRDA